MSPLRCWLMALWLLSLVVGSAIILLAPHGAVRHWTARSSLPAHHRLAAGDLAPPPITGQLPLPAKAELLGRYTRNAVGTGEALAPERLALVPDLALLAPGLAAVLSAAGTLVQDGGLNAGTEVALCHGRRALPERARVAVVLCAAVERCVALVPLSPVNFAWLAGAGLGAAGLDFNPGPGLRCRVDLPAPGALRGPSPAPPAARP